MSLQLFWGPGSLLIRSRCVSYVTALLGTGAAPRKLLTLQASGNRERPSRRRELHKQKQVSLEMYIVWGKGPERLEVGAWMCKGGRWEALYFPALICPEQCHEEHSEGCQKDSGLADPTSGPVCSLGWCVVPGPRFSHLRNGAGLCFQKTLPSIDFEPCKPGAPPRAQVSGLGSSPALGLCKQ